MKTTRIYTLLALLIVASMTIFSSCKKDPQIVGKWECTNDVLTEGDLQLDGSSAIGQIWEFKANGELVKEGEERAYGYSIEGDNLTITDTVSGLPNETQVFSQTATIQILTESQLSLLFDYQGNGELVVPRKMDFKRL